MKRDGFIFYQSFFEAAKNLGDEDRLKFYDSIVDYGIDGKETTSTGTVKALFSLVKPQIDANNKRFSDGKTGGRPPKEPVVIEKETSGYLSEKPKEKEKEKPKEKEKEKPKEKEKEKEKEELSKDKEQSSYGLEEINEVFSIVRSFNDGITDDKKDGKTRGIGKHLINKLKMIEKVKSGEYTRGDYLKSLLTVLNGNQYHRHKISGVAKIYFHLAELIQVANAEYQNKPLSHSIKL